MSPQTGHVIALDPASEAHFRRALLLASRYLGKTAPVDLLTLGATMFIRSAKKRTPGPPDTEKKRELRRREPTGRQRAPWVIVRLHRGTERLIPSMIGERDKRRKIRRRGLAKEHWSWMRLRLIKRFGGKTFPGVRRSAVQTVTDRRRRSQPAVVLESRLDYINKIAPNLAREALSAAARGIEHRIDRKVTRELQRIWT